MNIDPTQEIDRHKALCCPYCFIYTPWSNEFWYTRVCGHCNQKFFVFRGQYLRRKEWYVAQTIIVLCGLVAVALIILR